MKKIIVLNILVLLILVSCSGTKAGPAKVELPAGKAYAEGKVIYFIHTEASDAGVAEKLTNMMKSPVLLVPALADVPEDVLANVYVFTNGITGTGPLGFQPDVFDNPPNTPSYSPLRKMNLVTWVANADSTELMSAQDIMSAKDAGKLTIDQPGVVINMPFVVWEGGKR